MPTAAQLESRKQLKDFIDRVGGTLRTVGGKLKSEWFGRPDDELKGWIDRGRAISEISDSLGYRLIMETVEREIEWAQRELENCDEVLVRDLRTYLKSLRFVRGFVLTTEKNADIASSVLAGREAEIGRSTTTFIRGAQVRE